MLKQEGGWSDNPDDPGGATYQGITLGTLTRWNKTHGLPTPTKDDLRNLRPEKRDEIYRSWYWEASGADKMEWPLCLAVFDLAVNGGVGRAAEALEATGGDFNAFMDWREAWYRRLAQFPIFGASWLRRCRELREEAA